MASEGRNLQLPDPKGSAITDWWLSLLTLSCLQSLFHLEREVATMPFPHTDILQVQGWREQHTQLPVWWDFKKIGYIPFADPHLFPEMSFPLEILSLGSPTLAILVSFCFL